MGIALAVTQPGSPALASDCTAPPAPGINWKRCKLANQDLSGAGGVERPRFDFERFRSAGGWREDDASRTVKGHWRLRSGLRFARLPVPVRQGGRREMFHDDAPVRGDAAPALEEDLSRLSVSDLRERLERLQGEIDRVEQELESRQAGLAAAEAVFRSN
jgi:uncharacterized small protein (DUF1192 family)